MFFYTFLPKLWNMSLTASVVIICNISVRLTRIRQQMKAYLREREVFV